MKTIKAWALVHDGILDGAYSVDTKSHYPFTFFLYRDAVAARKWWADTTGSSVRFWRVIRVEIREVAKAKR